MSICRKPCGCALSLCALLRLLEQAQARLPVTARPLRFVDERDRAKSMSRNNPNIEDPASGGGSLNPDVEPQPLPPDIEPQPPVQGPPDQPGVPEGEAAPPPIGDPAPSEPTRLV